jgi:hypothetical protein
MHTPLTKVTEEHPLTTMLSEEFIESSEIGPEMLWWYRSVLPARPGL